MGIWKLLLISCYRNYILVSRRHAPFGQHQGLQPLSKSSIESLWFKNLSLNLTNLIGQEYDRNTQHLFRKLDPARVGHFWCCPKGAIGLWGLEYRNGCEVPAPVTDQSPLNCLSQTGTFHFSHNCLLLFLLDGWKRSFNQERRFQHTL